MARVKPTYRYYARRTPGEQLPSVYCGDIFGPNCYCYGIYRSMLRAQAVAWWRNRRRGKQGCRQATMWHWRVWWWVCYHFGFYKITWWWQTRRVPKPNITHVRINGESTGPLCYSGYDTEAELIEAARALAHLGLPWSRVNKIPFDPERQSFKFIDFPRRYGAPNIIVGGDIVEGITEPYTGSGPIMVLSDVHITSFGPEAPKGFAADADPPHGQDADPDDFDSEYVRMRYMTDPPPWGLGGDYDGPPE